jgi:hypothetical protein
MHNHHHDQQMMVYPDAANHEHSMSITARSQAVSFANARHVNILTRMITDGEWINALDFMKFNPSYGREPIVAHEFMGSYKDSVVYPIHLALSCSDVPMEFILACISELPQSIKKKETGYNRNMLHIAVRAGVQDSIISYLIQLYPEACSEQDSLGRLPIHYAVSNLRSLSLIQELLAIYPEAVRAWDVSGWTPLHIAVSNSSSSELVNLLLTLAPEMITFKTNRGSTPMEIAINSDSSNKDEIVPILRQTEDVVWSQPAFKSYQLAEEKCLMHQGSVELSGTYT